MSLRTTGKHAFHSGKHKSLPAFAGVATAVALLVVACAQLPVAPPTSPAAVVPPTAASSPAPPAAAGTDKPAAPRATAERGRISMYGSEFEGKKTASGTPFDPDGLTMAHRTLPFGTRVRVTNLANHRSVEVVVNDRGPAVAGRIGDLSRAAAQRIGMIADGVVEATLEILSPGSR